MTRDNRAKYCRFPRAQRVRSNNGLTYGEWRVDGGGRRGGPGRYRG